MSFADILRIYVLCLLHSNFRSDVRAHISSPKKMLFGFMTNIFFKICTRILAKQGPAFDLIILTLWIRHL